MMKCDNCDTPVDSSLEYCPECGAYQNHSYEPSKYSVLPGINTSGDVTSALSLVSFIIPILLLSLLVLSGVMIAVPNDSGGNGGADDVEASSSDDTADESDESADREEEEGEEENEGDTDREEMNPDSNGEDEEDQTESTETVPEPDDDDAYIDLLQNNLEERDIQTEAYEIADPSDADKTLIFGYRENPNASPEEIEESHETIALEITNLVESGWEMDGFVILVSDPDGNTLGQFHIEGEWIDSYLNGEISETEFLDEVTATAVAY